MVEAIDEISILETSSESQCELCVHNDEYACGGDGGGR